MTQEFDISDLLPWSIKKTSYKIHWLCGWSGRSSKGHTKSLSFTMPIYKLTEMPAWEACSEGTSGL